MKEECRRFAPSSLSKEHKAGAVRSQAPTKSRKLCQVSIIPRLSRFAVSFFAGQVWICKDAGQACVNARCRLLVLASNLVEAVRSFPPRIRVANRRPRTHSPEWCGASLVCVGRSARHGPLETMSFRTRWPAYSLPFHPGSWAAVRPYLQISRSVVPRRGRECLVSCLPAGQGTGCKQCQTAVDTMLVRA
jgi:hypothetical protein